MESREFTFRVTVCDLALLFILWQTLSSVARSWTTDAVFNLSFFEFVINYILMPYVARIPSMLILYSLIQFAAYEFL